MALFNRRKGKTSAPKEDSSGWLKEYAQVNGVSAYSFVQRNI